MGPAQWGAVIDLYKTAGISKAALCERMEKKPPLTAKRNDKNMCLLPLLP